MPANDTRSYQLKLIADERQIYPALADINYFLHDLNLLYEFTRVITDPKYAEFRLTRFFEYRNRERIERGDQLRVQRISKESPLEITLIVTAVGLTATLMGGLAPFAEFIRSIYLLPIDLKITGVDLQLKQVDLQLKNADLRLKELEARKLEAEVRHLERSAEISKSDRARVRHEIRTSYEALYKKLQKRLRRNPIRVRDIGIAELPRLPERVIEKDDEEDET